MGCIKGLFSHIEANEKLRVISMIVKDLSDPSVFLYMYFLKFILPTITSLNLLFQKETPTIFYVHYHLNKLYKTTLQYFCHKDLLNRSDISTFNPSD